MLCVDLRSSFSNVAVQVLLVSDGAYDASTDKNRIRFLINDSIKS